MGPLVPICLRDYSGDFAIDVWPFPELEKIAFPGCYRFITNTWFRNVIHDENLIGMLIDEGDCLREVVLEDEEIVGQSMRFKCCNTSVEILAENEIRVRLIVNGMPHSSELWQLGKLLEFDRNRRLRQISPAHHPKYQIIGRCQRGEPNSSRYAL